MKKLDLTAIFQSDAEELISARTKSKNVHGSGNIRASGDEVEIPVRDYFRRMLPSRYYVTQGHIVDRNGAVSPQLDLIIADNNFVASLLTTKDGTEYVPIESVYAIGEVKSTYYSAKRYVELFSATVRQVRHEMAKVETLNTAFGGKIDRKSKLEHMANTASKNRVLNYIFAFMLFVDAGDFQFDDIKPFLRENDKDVLPNVSAFLNKAIVHYGKVTDENIVVHHYPEWCDDPDCRWLFASHYTVDEDRAIKGSVEGGGLAFLYQSILQHLSQSRLDPPPIHQYLRCGTNRELIEICDPS